MRITKAGHEIQSIDDWFQYAPPKMGERHWKDGRSAKELARSWFRNGVACPPDELRELLEQTFGPEIAFSDAKPECVIQLDDFHGEHRNCDLVVLCTAGSQSIALNIEAKADEAFGDTIGEYYARKVNSASNAPARINQLSMALFGLEPDAAIRQLRYQLLHAAAAALIEAVASNAKVGVLLVHEFRSPSLSARKLAQNRMDWENFVHAFPELPNSRFDGDQILGPVSVPGGGRVPGSMPLYLGKLVTELEKS